MRIVLERLGEQVAGLLGALLLELQLGQVRQRVLVEVVGRILGVKFVEQHPGSFVLARDVRRFGAAKHGLAGEVAFRMALQQLLEPRLGIVQAAQLNERLAAEEQGLRAPGMFRIVAQECLELVDRHLPPGLRVVPGRNGILIQRILRARLRSRQQGHEQHRRKMAQSERHGMALGSGG